jgi:hypothetical protein
MARILDAALADVREAAHYFQEISAELRRRFLTEFEVTFVRIAEAPELEPKWLAPGVPDGTRHASFPRFPHHLIFIVEDDGIPLVLAMRAYRQDHLDWLGRMPAREPVP